MLKPEEIQDLLNQPLKEGTIHSGLWAGETQNYDFLKSKAEKEFKAQGVTTIHEVASQACATWLGQLISREITVAAISHDSVQIGEFIAKLALDTQLAFVWSDENSGQEGLLMMDRSLFFQFYSILFGGKKGGDKTGGLTALEKNFLNKVLTPCVESIENAWNQKTKISFAIKQFIEKPKDLVELGWSFDALSVPFQVTIPDLDGGKFTFVFQKSLLKQLVVEEAPAEGTEGSADAGPHRDKHWVEKVTLSISERVIPCQVLLGTLKMALKDVLKLEVGGVYPLQVLEGGYPIHINGRQAFLGEVGMSEGCRAVKITQFNRGGSHGGSHT